MYILTNTWGIKGAAAILYTGVLKDVAGQIGGDLLIVPSSIHEIILMKWNGKEGIDLETVAQIIHEINQSIVSEKEILSDSVYIYRRSEDRVVWAAGRKMVNI